MPTPHESTADWAGTMSRPDDEPAGKVPFGCRFGVVPRTTSTSLGMPPACATAPPPKVPAGVRAKTVSAPGFPFTVTGPEKTTVTRSPALTSPSSVVSV